MLSLLGQLDRSRYAPSLIVLSNTGPLQNMLPTDVPLTDLELPRLRRAAWPLFRAVRRARPQVVVSSLGYVNLALLAGRHFLPRGTRIAIREANMPSRSLPAGPWPGLMRRLYRRYYCRADAVICSSRAMRGEMAGEFAVAASRLHLMPNPVDEPTLRAKASAAVTRGGGGVNFVAAGRLTRQKGFDRLIELFSGMPGDSRLTILGAGPEHAALEALGRKLKGRVALFGFTERPWPHYASADAFLLSSRWEGMPNAALEALACGTPVIATPESGAIGEIAVEAPPGAVTMASWGSEFAEAMARVVIRTDALPGPSLLPPGHEPEAVARRFENILVGES